MDINSKFFKTQEIYDGATAISGLIGELAFLIRGREKALLIDTLTGIGSLKAFCRELTDLPLTVVNTHGHVDHVGSNAEFERVYIHPLDMDMMYYQMTVNKKIDFLRRIVKVDDLVEESVKNNDFVKEKGFYAIPISEGEYFDLGGKIIEVIHTPGHSRGSVALLDVNKRIVFIGDILCQGVLMCLEHSTSVQEYHEGLKNLKTYDHRFDRMIWSHNLELVTSAQLDEGIEASRDVLEGRDDAEPYPEHPFYHAKKTIMIDGTLKRTDGKWANILYDKNFLYKKERSKEIVDYKTRNFNMFD